MDTTFETIRRLARDTLDVPEPMLLRAATLREAGVDSLGAIDLVFAIEAHYGITISPEQLACVRSLKDFAAVAERLIAREVCRQEAHSEACHEA